MTTDGTGRRYSDEECALILRHAAGSDEGPDLPSGDSGGLTLDEIVAAAGEAGIDPQAVVRAAALVPVAATPRRPFLGGPERYQLEYRTPGVIAERHHADIVDSIRRTLGHHGTVASAFGGIEWHTEGWVSRITVTVVPRERGTAVRVMADRSAAVMLTFVLPTVGGLVGFGITGAILEPSGVLPIAGLFAATVGGGLLTARALWARGSRRFRRLLDRLMTNVSAAVDGSAEDQPT